MIDSRERQFLETVYGRTDTQIREILKTFEIPSTNYGIDIVLGDGQIPLIAGIQGQIEVPESGRIVQARLFTGKADPVSSAVLTLTLSSWEEYPGFVNLHGDGIPASMTLQNRWDVDTTGWFRRLVLGDIITYSLDSFSGGSSLTLSLLIRRIRGISGLVGIVDEAGEQLVDENGERIVLRT